MKNGVFIFLGKRQPLSQLDYEQILNNLDRLLPLYRYVESDGKLQLVPVVTVDKFTFHSGCTSKISSTAATQAQKELDIDLRHNVLQEALHHQLAEKYGAENVGTELQSGVGTSVDVVVQHTDEYWFYEIKTSRSPRACIRQALGQLLEYAFWPGSQNASRLIVVGETALDGEGSIYLHTLKERFSLPIEYKQIVVE